MAPPKVQKAESAPDSVEPPGDAPAVPPVRAKGRLLYAVDDSLLHGNTHYGLAVRLKSGDEKSALMIPDVEGVKTGKPLYISGPVVLQGKKLKDFLIKKKIIAVDHAAARFLSELEIDCPALYYAREQKEGDAGDGGVLLFVIEVKFDAGNDNKGGLIQSLTGDADLGNLFDITGAYLRVFRCPRGRFRELEEYCEQQEGNSAA